LRDDLFLELSGASADELAPLDRSDANCRRLYFFRRSIQTLNELSAAINTPEYTQLTTDSEDDTHQVRQLREAARRARRTLNEVRDTLKFARDKGSGHVDFARSSEVLSAHPGFRGPIDLADVPRKTMYRLASHAMHLVILDLDEETEDVVLKRFEELVEIAFTCTLTMIEALDCVISIYVHQHRR